ncbi:hypothetical protein EDC02_4985 [Micromonospora sp. Llam0]|nr:hypothetical protein EDC02_4985 [Micromonospora sp. Llam0]
MQTLTRNAKRDADDGVLSCSFGRPGADRRVGTSRRWRWVAGLGVLLLGLAGCDSSVPTGQGSSAPSLSAPAQSTRGSAEQQALAAYEGMWQAYAAAGLTADPDEPDLARYASGQALTTLRDGLAQYREDDQFLKGDLVTHPQVTDASPDPDPTSVTVTDCLDDTKFLVYKRSGELVDDAPGGRRYTKATVTNLGAEGWKVTSFGVQAVNTC